MTARWRWRCREMPIRPICTHFNNHRLSFIFLLFCLKLSLIFSFSFLCLSRVLFIGFYRNCSLMHRWFYWTPKRSYETPSFPSFLRIKMIAWMKYWKRKKNIPSKNIQVQFFFNFSFLFFFLYFIFLSFWGWRRGKWIVNEEEKRVSCRSLVLFHFPGLVLPFTTHFFLVGGEDAIIFVFSLRKGILRFFFFFLLFLSYSKLANFFGF